MLSDVKNMCCFKCLVEGMLAPADHMHHLVYDNPKLPMVPLCVIHHAEITAMNCDASRSRGYRRLTGAERSLIWLRFGETLGNAGLYSRESWARSLERLENRSGEIDDDTVLDLQLVRYKQEEMNAKPS